MKKKLTIAILLLLLSPGLLAQDESQSVEEIYNTAQLFAYQQIQTASDEELSITVNPIDSRLKFKQCAHSLEGFLPQGMNSQALRLVGIKCADPSWSLFVPVKVSILSPVLVAAKLLPKDQLITEGDIVVSRQDKMALHQGYFKNKAEIVGKTPRKPLQAGFVFTPDTLQTNKVVKRGDLITIIAKTGSLTVKSQGLAMEDGEVGATIKVKNDQSKRVIEGIVASAGVITIPL